MNLLLDFGSPASTLLAPRDEGLSETLALFERVMQETDSPVRAIRHDPARPAEFRPFPPSVSGQLREACEQRGIQSLYSHQAEAIEHVAGGRNVTVVTPTASGKTLCYNLPVLQSILNSSGARAFYLFPTKALAEDQRQELDQWMSKISDGVSCYCYDGDTPQDARRSIRDRASVVLTNPDMLHTGILPHH